MTLRRFPGPEGYRFVMDELPMAQGWALIAHEVENDPWLAVERSSEGYIGQEVERLMAMVK